MQFLSGNKRENKWFQIFSKKDHKFLYSNCNLNKKNVLKAVTLQGVKPQPNFILIQTFKKISHGKVLFQN